MLPGSILDIIVVVYYLPAFVLSLIVLFKQGRRGIAGWISLTLLGIFRLVGSSTGVAAEYKPSISVIATSLILSNIGTISLLAALMGVIKRVNTSMSSYALSERQLRLTQLPVTIAAILAVVGGTKTFDSDPSEQSEGRTLTRAAIILLLIVYLIAIGLCVYTTSHKRDVLNSERRLLLVSTLSLPFVLVRLILAFCSAFRSTDPNFSITSTTNNAIIIRAVMGILMEFIVVGLFLWAGLTVKTAMTQKPRHGQKTDFEAVDIQ